jgi:hypothetical protein
MRGEKTKGKGDLGVLFLITQGREDELELVPRQETQLGVLGTPSTTIYTKRRVQYHHDIMGYELP